MKLHFITTILFANLLIASKPALAAASRGHRNYFKADTLPATDNLILQLGALNLANYRGLPTDSLLAHLPAGASNMEISSWNYGKTAEVLWVRYPSDVFVMIFVRSFVYMNPDIVNTSTPKQNWQIDLFRKEALTHAIIYNGSSCINGCENEYK